MRTVAFYAFAIAGLWSPVTMTVPLLTDAAKGPQFISTLWTVEASTIALSIAVIVFALQSIVTASPGSGSLKEVVEDSHLLWLIRLGIAGLLLDGLVLLGVGPGAPTGWPATWACLLSLASIPALGIAIRFSLTSVDPGILHIRRLRRLRSRVDEAVRDEMLQRLAQAHLTTWADSNAVTAELLVRQVPLGWTPVAAPRDGIVADVKLSRFEHLTQRVMLGQRQTSALVFVSIGSLVQRGRPLCALPPAASALEQCRARSAFRVRP